MVLLIFEYIPTFKFFPKMGKTASALVHHDGARFLPEMEKKADERLSDKIV